MKHLLFLFLIFIFGNYAFSQTPGYMGKRWAVHGSTSVSPALNYHHQQADEEGLSTVPGVGINCILEASTDFTINKSLILGASIKQIKTQMPYAYYTYPIAGVNFYGSYLGDIDIDAKFTGVYFKYFPFQEKGSIAPVGKYIKLELVYGNYTVGTGGWSSVRYDPVNIDLYQQMEITNAEPSFENLNYEIQRSVFGALYSFGNTSAIFNRFLLDFGTQFGYIGYPTNDDVNRIMQGSYNGELLYDFESDVRSRLAGAFLFNIHLGIGILVL